MQEPDTNNKVKIINPSKICRTKTVIYNRKECKRYQMVYTKRRIVAGYDTVPYGY